MTLCACMYISNKEQKETREIASTLLLQPALHVLLVLLEHLVLREHLEHLVQLDYLDLLVNKDQKESKDYLAMMGRMELRVHLAMMV